MTRKLFLALGVAMVLAGCGLIPKSVEFGQKKVKAIPARSDSAIEAQKQAAAFVVKEVIQAREAALESGASTNVLVPLGEARDASMGLAYSLGSPAAPWNGSGAELALRMGRLENKLDRAIDAMREKQTPLVGKTIEGTGFIQMPWIVWVSICAIAFVLGKWALEVGGELYPPLGVGVSGLREIGRIPAEKIRRGFVQTIHAGEEYKDEILKSDKPAEVKEWATSLFRTVMQGKHDQDVQGVIKQLTQK